MPRKEIDYSHTHFYKIVCKDLNIKDCYVGQTTNFKNRKYEHKKTCSNPKSKNHNSNVYVFSREKGHWDNWDMVLIETMCCTNYLEALKRERELIELTNATLNIHRPLISNEEWKAYSRNYYYTNINYIKDKRKQRQNETVSYMKAYYQNKKDDLKIIRQGKIDCECGSSVRKCHLKRHERTIKHQEYQKALQPEETPEQ